MIINNVKSDLLSGNDLYFIVDDMESGVSSEVLNNVFTFTMWYGTEIKNTNSIDEVLFAPFFGGKSILELTKSIYLNFT